MYFKIKQQIILLFELHELSTLILMSYSFGCYVFEKKRKMIEFVLFKKRFGQFNVIDL